MGVFLAVPLSVGPSDALDQAVLARIEEADRLQLQGGRGWLIRHPGTSVEVSSRLGITGQAEGTPPAVPSGLVVAVGGYFGRAPTEMWEWIRSRLESS